MSELATAVLPFLILLGFWAFLVRRVRQQAPPQEAMLEKLEAIRSELERLRRAVEQRNI